MKMHQKFFAILLITCSLSFAALAEINMVATKKVSVGKFSFGVGSEVRLYSTDPNLNGSAIFLGANLTPSKEATNLMFLHPKSSKVIFIDSKEFNANSTLQPILDSYPQAGGTCTGYAMDNFLIQTHMAGFQGSGELAKILSTEDGRTTLLVDLINEYYLNMNRRYSIRGILNGYGKKLGYKCSTFSAENLEKAKDKVFTQLQNGFPVLVSFTIGPKMVKSPFPLSFYQRPDIDSDDRLWVPRKIGERNSGGHSVVAAAAFSYNQKNYLVMIDSDWSQPRLWDFDQLFNERTALDEVEFTSCL